MVAFILRMKALGSLRMAVTLVVLNVLVPSFDALRSEFALGVFAMKEACLEGPDRTRCI